MARLNPIILRSSTIFLSSAFVLSIPICHMRADTIKAQSPAIAAASKAGFSLGNQYLEARGTIRSGHWDGIRILDRANRHSVLLPEAFTLTLQDNTVLRSSGMSMTQPLTVTALPVTADASRFSERIPGKQVCTEFSDNQNDVRVDWCGILRDGSNYFRQQIVIHAGTKPLPVTEISLLNFKDANARVMGTVKGSPIADNTMFFGFEYPLSEGQVKDGNAAAYLPRVLPIQAGRSVTYSSVAGVAPAGQMRRAFLRYIERERAHPYRPFLQYNSWYDLDYNNMYGEAGAMDRIRAFGTELTQKRGATVHSFVFDDGWDNPHSFWQFNAQFPDGFRNAEKVAEQYHSHIGLWLSPWGGYNEAKQERIASGKKMGYEVMNGGFALSGPKYYAGFEKICLDMIHNYDANEFKFDGTGNASSVFPGSRFDSDFDAMIALIHRLRQVEPNIFINLTTGTKPSPFWLFYSDGVWRGGDDHEFTGVGSSRQRWITYRDASVYQHIVQQGPLFPLNSLMLHGMIYAKFADGLKTDPKNDFRDEVESFFGSGTQVQEMYITPSLLNSADWDALAQGAKWSVANAETLKDTHWIGGDPAKLQVYGWASWSPKEAIIVLRNPSDKPQGFSLDIQPALQLPDHAPRKYVTHDPWNSAAKPVVLEAGHPTMVQLKPWEVRTFQGTPSH